MKSVTYDMLSSLILANQFVTPSTCRRGRKDVVDLIRSVGGLQWGAEDLSLLSRLHHVETSWIRDAVEKKELLEVHVLRGGLRIIPSEEYPYYFAGTREVIERIADRRLVPLTKMTDDHRKILRLVSREGPIPLKEIRQKINLPNTRNLINQLLIDGALVRAGRKKTQVLIATLENWLPEMILEDTSAEEARLWMARKFLTVYGPSTEAELAHWAGWTLTRGKNVLAQLSEKGDIEKVFLGDSFRFMLYHTEFPEKENTPYLRILHNDDEIHLACSGRCRELFGFNWKYRFSTTAAVLQNNRILGEITLTKRNKVITVGTPPQETDASLFSDQLERLENLWHGTIRRT
jgi:uncharacterized protein YcaQ